MDWDEGPDVGGPHAPYYQSQRSEIHQKAAEQLLASGHAYRDYARPEELQKARTAAEKRGERYFYDRQWMAENDEQSAAYEAEGRPKTVRLKIHTFEKNLAGEARTSPVDSLNLLDGHRLPRMAVPAFKGGLVFGDRTFAPHGRTVALLRRLLPQGLKHAL